jgi:glycosyltransferase involved in cell wall biosynthesis
MIIGIDAREIQNGVFTGIGKALNNFLIYFRGLVDEHRIVLFSEKTLPMNYGARITSVVHESSWITIYWDQIVLLKLIKKYQIELFYSPYYKVPLLISIPVISTIFDLMYIYYPTKWRGNSLFSRWYYRIVGGMMVKKTDEIFTCSNYSKSEIIRFYKVPDRKITVIHLGLSDEFHKSDSASVSDVKRKFKVVSPYILYMGNFKPHKNVSLLIDAFKVVKNLIPDLQLVLAGNKDHNFALLHEQIRLSSAESAIVTTGLVTLNDQIALYSGASVFVFPSLYEGFGYPPLEAMACGTPIVSSDRTSLDEIIGDAAVRCNPLSVSDLAQKICTLFNDAELRKRCIERGFNQVKKFTNAKYCNEFYTMLLSRSYKG